MAAPANPTDKDPRSLHELAVDISTDIGKLAVGLAHAGAPPKITDQLRPVGGLFDSIAKGLAAGPVGAAPSDGGAPAPMPAGGPPQGAPAPPSAPAPAGPPPGPGTPQNIAPARGPIHNSLAQAHAEHLAAMAKAR